MEIQWLGHSAFCLGEAGKNILIDPFLSGNPQYPEDSLIQEQEISAIVLTHGHGDHLGDTLELAKKKDCPVYAVYEICCWLERNGHSNCEPMNIGGSVMMDGKIKISLVQALHSASIVENGRNEYMGCACGTVISAASCVVYHAGDTGIFSDMSLIQKIHRPDVGLIPIGDRFTMGPETAALACNEFLDLKVIVPMHYGTFPLLTGKPEVFAGMVKKGEVRILEPGQTMLYP